MRSNRFYGTAKVARFILRRDRIQLPVWILAIALSTIGISGAFPSLYPTAAERAALALTMENPAIVAMIGPVYGIHDYTYGAMVAHEMLLFMALTAAVMNILLVTRHTRTDEEHGRLEMIRSLPVGRLANLTATLLVMGLANVVLAVVTGLGLFALGIESMDLEGSMLFGAAMGIAGLVFAGITAVLAQLAETSRGTLGFSFGLLGLAYLLRAIGDIGSEPLALASPLGLILRTQAYVNNYWWPIWVAIAIALVVGGFALYLNAVRDLGAGLVPARPGKRHASHFLQTPFGLALRLLRTTVIAWTITAFVLGAAYGSVFGDLEAFFESSDIMKQLLPMTDGFSLTEQFTSVIIMVMSMVSAIPVLLVTLKLHGEERAHRVEPILAAAVRRERLMGSYLGLAILLSVVVQVMAALGLWLAAASVMTEPMSLGSVLRAAMAYLPAIWMMVGLVALVVGWKPRLTGLTWIYLVYTFVVLYLGGLLQLPTWMEWVTPFGHIPQLPVDTMHWAPLIVLTLLAVAAMSVGTMGYRRRDIRG